jgi:hypothetical protein
MCFVLKNAWDAYVIPARQGSVMGRRAFASHDEWLQINS